MKRVYLAATTAALALLPTGCGGSPGPVPVGGTVRWQGRPLAGGLVVFAPDADRGCRGPLAFGTVGPDGAYSLATEAGPGVPPGVYRITVTETPPATDSPLPARFCHPDLSGLRAEVRPGPAVALDWDLVGDP
jgi:hypothetical protein